LSSISSGAQDLGGGRAGGEKRAEHDAGENGCDDTHVKHPRDAAARPADGADRPRLLARPPSFTSDVNRQ